MKRSHARRFIEATLQHESSSFGHTAGELFEQPCLADTRLAEKNKRLSITGTCGSPRVYQTRQFGSAAYETVEFRRRQTLCCCGRRLLHRVGKVIGVIAAL